MFSLASVCSRGGVRVSLVPGPFWRVGYLGVGYIEGKTGVGYTLAPLRVKATAAVGTHPTGMLSCLNYKRYLRNLGSCHIN